MKTEDRHILRLPEAELRTGYKRPTLYRKEALGEFPRRIKLGRGQGGAVGWLAADIDRWLDARRRGVAWTPTDHG
jgi:prophage regulatory protein